MPLKKILQYLQENFKQADEAANPLSISIDRCKNFVGNKNFTEEQYEFNDLSEIVVFCFPAFFVSN